MKKKIGIKKTKMNIFWLFLIGLIIGVVIGLRQSVSDPVVSDVNPAQISQGKGNQSTTAGKAETMDKDNLLYMDLDYGRVEILLNPQIAPNHVARIKELTRQGFYDGVKFHRVIPGFMAQTGDPTGTGMGGSGKKLKAEFNQEPHVRGTVSMARAMDPDSADSQFFICFDDARFLDGQYTVFGKVISGMEYIDMIKAGTSANNGAVANPDIIVKMQVASDVKE